MLFCIYYSRLWFRFRNCCKRSFLYIQERNAEIQKRIRVFFLKIYIFLITRHYDCLTNYVSYYIWNCWINYYWIWNNVLTFDRKQCHTRRTMCDKNKCDKHQNCERKFYKTMHLQSIIWHAFIMLLIRLKFIFWNYILNFFT